jgi:hypothetical protein
MEGRSRSIAPSLPVMLGGEDVCDVIVLADGDVAGEAAACD